MSGPPTIDDFQSFSDLQEAIDEFKRYSDRTTSLYERTMTCIHEIVARVPADKAEAMQSTFLLSKQEEVERELQKSPSVFFIGERNCGKSSIVNELLQQSSLPVHENPCTARIVRIKYSEQSYARLVGRDGTEVKREVFHGKHLPENLIVIKDEDRENQEVLDTTVEVGLDNSLLRSGIELIDSPGRSESEVLDRVLDEFLNKDTVPLFVYVINGDTRLTCSDHQTLDFLKDKFPLSHILFICNKVDTTNEAKKYDCRAAARIDSHDDDDDGGGSSGCNSDGDDDHNAEEDEDKDEGEEENREGKEHEEEGAVINKGKAVFKQLRDKFALGETWETCPLYYAMSTKEVRHERLAKQRAESTRRFRRFQSSLQDHLGKVIKAQTRRAVQKLLVLQESFASVVQVQRTSITKKASVMPQILQKATNVQSKMLKSLSAITLESQESKTKMILEDLESLKVKISHEAEVYKVDKPKNLQREFQTMVKDELPSYSNSLLNAAFDIAFAKFVGDMKSSILEKTCQALENAVQVLMKDCVTDLTIAVIEFNKDLSNPIVSHILEEIYDLQFLAAKAETDERLQHVMNALLDSMNEVAIIALRTEISEPLSKCLCPEDLSIYNVDVRKKTTRRSICGSLLATIDFKHVVDSVREACTSHLLKMHKQFMAALSLFRSLQDAFSDSDISLQLELFRLHFTPQIRKLTVEGMALRFLQIFGPVTFGLPIAQARHGGIYECTSRRWCGVSPSGQCVVKALDKRDMGEGAWNQTAVDLVDMMNMIEKLHGSHTNLLRLHGWVIPEDDVLHVVMERVDRGLLTALQEGLPLYKRMRIALDVADGLKAIHDIDYIYVDLKPGNILLMSDGTAKINLTKPVSPYDMTPLGVPFHISPEMYKFHSKGHLSYSSYDIYAFGMLLWVLFEGTGTARPEVYKGLETIEAMQEVVVKGVVPKRLPVMSDACWELMSRCWDERESLQMVHLVTKLQLIYEEYMSKIDEK